MKTIAIAVFFTLLLCLTTSMPSAPVYAASSGAMSGKYNYGSKGYRQAAREKNVKGTKAKKSQ
jgi:hypothetical protein